MLRIFIAIVLLFMASELHLLAQEHQVAMQELPVRDSAVVEAMPTIYISSVELMGEMPARMMWWDLPYPMDALLSRKSPYYIPPSAITPAVKASIPRNKYTAFSPNYFRNPIPIHTPAIDKRQLNKVEIVHRSWWPYTFME